MSTIELRTAVSECRTQLGKLQTERAKLDDRRRAALASERLDEPYVTSPLETNYLVQITRS
jgi:hypothetical protein